MICNLSRSFFLTAVVILAAVLAASQLLFFTVFGIYDFPGRMAGILLVWLMTCAAHCWVMKTVTDRPKAFSRVFLTQTTVKLLLYMACILVYLILFRQHGIPFTVHFLVVYVIFALFEVFSILKFVNSNHGKSHGKS